MYTTYAGAKRCAKDLQAWLRRHGVPLRLCECQNAMARAGRYRDWMHLRQSLRAPGAVHVEGSQTARNLLAALPLDAVVVAGRWLDKRIAHQRALDGPIEYGMTPEDRYWLAHVHEYAWGIRWVHLKKSMLRQGGGAGLRLRQEMLYEAVFNMASLLDREKFTLILVGTAFDIFGRCADHRHFERELARMIDAGIFSWTGDLRTGGTLLVHPTSVNAVRAHVDVRRLESAAYDKGYEAYCAGQAE